MRQLLMRAVGALAASVTALGVTVVLASPAGAIEPGIGRPTLTVVCSQPHHGKYFSAVRFRQLGRAAAGGTVRVTIARPTSSVPRAIINAQTGADGSFRIVRRLYSHDLRPWVAGARYTWTTLVYGDTWATARRGSVRLTGSC